jgi:subtilisin family serine protease
VLVQLDVSPWDFARARSHASNETEPMLIETREALFAQLAQVYYRVTRQFERVPFVALEIETTAIASLQGSDRVVSVVEDRPYYFQLSESIPLIGAEQAAEEAIDGDGWAVVVVDSGVDASHPFLSGRVIEEACFSATANCPNRRTEQFGIGAAAPCDFGARQCDHGTHVAGIIAGANGSLNGVATGAEIIAIQVSSRGTPEQCPSPEPCAVSYLSDLVAALEHALKLNESYRIAAVNMSLGGQAYTTQAECDRANPPMKQAIDGLRAAGIATIAASGNGGFLGAVSAPACISSAVSVGATSKSDEVRDSSNCADFLALLAPGVQIRSSVPGGGFRHMSGTSMATAHVSGAWALLRQLSPSTGVDEILSLLQRSGVQVVDHRNGMDLPRLYVGNVFSARSGPDCNGDGAVTVDELILGVNIALGTVTASACPVFDLNRDGIVDVSELIMAVSTALSGH